MAGSFVSRRLSEFIGVALFAMALMWLISLASYSPADPVWFFTTGSDSRRSTSAVASARFSPSCRISCSATRPTCCRSCSSSSGWHYFWCRVPDAAYTKLVGAGLLFACVSSFLSLAFGTLRVANREILAGGYAREMAGVLPRRVPQQDRIDHPDPDAALPLDRPVHAVLVRAALRRAVPAGSRSRGRHARQHARSAGRDVAANASGRRS